MKKIIMWLMLALSMSAFAEVSMTEGLTKEQVAELAATAAKMKATPVNVSATVRKEAEAWGELGGNVGKAMVGAAKEIGIAANDFASTGLGKVVTAIVVYKLVGYAMIKLLVGSFILLIGTICGWWLLTHKFGEMTYEYKPFLFGMWQRKVVVSEIEDTNSTIARMWGLVFIVVATLLVGLPVIF